MRLELKGNQRHGFNHVAYSFDGSTVAVSDVDMWVEVRRDGEVILEREFASRQDKVRSVQRVHGLAFSHDGTRLFVAAADQIIAVSIPSGEIAWSYQPPRYLGFLIVPPTAVATSPGGWVAGAFENGMVAVWDPSGQLKRRWHSADSPRSIGFLPDGDRLVGTDSFSLTRWQAEAGVMLARVRLDDRAYGVAVAPHSGVVATRGVRRVTLWDAETLTPTLELPSPRGLPIVVFHPDEPEFAVPSMSCVNIYGFDGVMRRRHDVDGARVVSLAYSPAGGTLTVGCSDRTVRRL